MFKISLFTALLVLCQISLNNCKRPSFTNPYAPRKERWKKGLISFFTRELIVPYCVRNVTNVTCEIFYPPNTKIETGMDYDQTEVVGQPIITWNADPDAYYLLYMLGYTEFYVYSETFYPFYVTNSPEKEWIQWLVHDIPGTKISKGKALYPYLDPVKPAIYVGDIYAVVIYKQPHKRDYILPKMTRYGIHDFCKHLEFLDLNNITDWPAAANLFVFRDLPEISEFRGPYSSTLDPHIWAEPTTRSPRFIVPFDPSIINATSWR